MTINSDKNTARPLSFVKYFRNNLRKSLALTIALVLSVFMILIFQMIIFGVNEPARIGDVSITDHFTKVFTGDSGKIDSSVIQKLKENPAFERMIPMDSQDMDYNHFFGTCNICLFFIEDKEVPYIMDKLGVKLKSGRLPVPGKNEVLLDWRAANNKGKKLGDDLGKAVDPDEKVPGKYKIVGITEGKALLALSPVDASRAANLPYLLVSSKDGRIKELNTVFSNLSRDKAHYWNKEKADDNYRKNSSSLNTIFGVMSFAIIFVMAFASGNSSYAQYFSRRFEFGVLQSIGYTRGQILLRAAKEILLLNLIGFVGGVLLGLLTGLALEKGFFNPHGYPFTLIQPQGFIQALTIPVCTALFGLIPAGWLLSKIDPMMAVEKFE